MTRPVGRRLPVGAEIIPGGGVEVRVWAPARQRVEVVVEAGAPAPAPPAPVALTAEGDGYFSGVLAAAGAGTRYRFRLDGADALLPDPASRFQPEGPDGPSEVVDPGAFGWTDDDWPGVSPEGQVIYEMHVGTFTPAGTWAAATAELPALADLGITLIEVMPVNEFPGRFGWGYDGVAFYAPSHLYGGPDDLRRFVDRAHGLGLGVILDVVYNHFGPRSNYLPLFAPDYASARHQTEWGPSINFDGERSGPVREFFIANAGYWIDEYHLDGLRLDATQAIVDDSAEHLVAAVSARVRRAGGRRSTFLVGENEPQRVRFLRPIEAGGYGLDALWNDDFHHAARVALTGRAEGYLIDYAGTPQELIGAVKRGFLYQGQYSAYQRAPRGTPTEGVPPAAFVVFLQNHDQVANTPGGARLHQLASPGRYRVFTALALLAPGTPMLFQGQEFAASAPFHYFADFGGELADQIRAGRRAFLAQFAANRTLEMQAALVDPCDPATFARSKLDLGERQRHAPVHDLYRDLLRLRRTDPVLRGHGRDGVDGAVLGPRALALRLFGPAGDDRLVLLNYGADVRLTPRSEPLLAPPLGRRWMMLWSSEQPRYGGTGGAFDPAAADWVLSAETAVLLTVAPPSG